MRKGVITLDFRNESAFRYVLLVKRIVLFASITTLVGCSPGNDESTSVTQVAAIVNGDEITVHQLNDALGKRGTVPQEQASAARKEALEQLIDQQLAVQQAVASKLDRSPKVMRAIEAAKNEILARAYLESVVESAPQRYEWDLDNQEEVRKYYEDNPELFSERRIFTIEEINFMASEDLASRLRKETSENAGMQQIADWLKANNVKFEARRGTRAAEQISLNVLPEVQKLNPGEIKLFVLGNGRYQILRVASTRPAPVDQETATPRIQQFLANQQSTRILTEEMQRVRQSALVEYVGEFAEAGVDTGQSGSPQAANE